MIRKIWSEKIPSAWHGRYESGRGPSSLQKPHRMACCPAIRKSTRTSPHKPLCTRDMRPRCPVQATRRRAALPGPRGWPLAGNAFSLMGPRRHHVVSAWAEQYGGVFSIDLWGTQYVVVTDPAGGWWAGLPH
jgi:hypothetical protein